MSQFTVIKKAFGQSASGPSTTRMAIQRRSYPFLSQSASSRMQVFTLKKRNVDRTPYLTFTALDPDSSVKLTYMAEDAEAQLSTSQNLSGVSFEISENGGDWTQYGFQQTSMNTGDTLKIRATDKNNKLALNETYGLRFIMTGRIAASGSIMSLLYSNAVSSFQGTNNNAAFAYLFKNCSALVAAPELPAETVYGNVYQGMFTNCVNLSAGPVLRVNNSKYGRYAFAHMFENCRGLTSVEGDISISDNQTDYMFNGMFKNCVSLVSPPDISVLHVNQDTFYYTFEHCSSLTSTLDMTVHDIINGRYSFAGMYHGCNSLKTNRLCFDIISAGSNCFREMFRDCWNLRSAPNFGEISANDDGTFLSTFSNCLHLSSTPSLTAVCVSKDAFKYMFKGCKHIQTCQNISLPAMNLSQGCYYGMFEQCNALTDTPQLPATTLATDCYRAMFGECHVLKDAPYLPATALATTSYRYMFNNCKSLSSISVELTSWNPSGATNSWTTYVPKTGVFTCPASLAQTRGANNIPAGWTINTH